MNKLYVSDKEIDDLYSIFEHMSNAPSRIVDNYIDHLRTLAGIIDLPYDKFYEMTGYPLISDEDVKDAIAQCNYEQQLFNSYSKYKII